MENVEGCGYSEVWCVEKGWKSIIEVRKLNYCTKEQQSMSIQTVQFQAFLNKSNPESKTREINAKFSTIFFFFKLRTKFKYKVFLFFKQCYTNQQKAYPTKFHPQ